jgi:hypothetical protein
LPSDACEITTDTNFTNGIYFLPHGINIINSITLDCKGSTILGQNGVLIGDSIGINVTAPDVTIKNCVIKNFQANYTSPTISTSNPRHEIAILTNSNNINIFNNTFINNGVAINSRFIRNNIRFENNNIVNCHDYGDQFLGISCLNAQRFNNSIFRNNIIGGDGKTNVFVNIWFGNHIIENNIFTGYSNFGTSGNPSKFRNSIVKGNTFFSNGTYYNSFYDFTANIGYLEVFGNSPDLNNVFVDNIFINYTINFENEQNNAFCQGVKDNTYINSGTEGSFSFPTCDTDYIKIKYHEDFGNNYNFMIGNSSKRIFTDSDYNEARELYGELKGSGSNWALGYTKSNSVTTDITMITETDQDLINSRYGMSYGFDNSAIGNINAQVFFTTILNNSVNFKNDDYIRFTCNNEESSLLSVTEKNYIYLLLGSKNLSINNTLMISLINDGCSDSRRKFDFPAPNSWATPYTCINIQDLTNGLTCENSKQTIDIQKKDIMEFSDINLDNIERMDFFFYSSGSYDTMGSVLNSYIDDLTIYTAYDNKMPFVNITSPKLTYCINSSEESIEVKLNITAFDTEGDQIYYSTKAGDSINKSVKTTFTRRNCLIGLCDITPNWQAIDNFVYPYNDTCEINTNLWTFAFRFAFDLFNIEDINGNERIMLAMENTCEKNDKSIYFKIPKPSKTFSSEVSIYDLNNGEALNISILDTELNKFIILGLEKSANITYFYNYNTTKSLIGSVENIENFKVVLNGQISQSYGIGIINGTIPSFIFIKDGLNYFSVDNTYASLYSISNSDITTTYLDYIKIGYSVSDPIFSTIPPNSINLAPGSNFIALYTTDSAHLGENYNIDFLQIDVYESALCPDVTINEVNTDLFEYKNPNGLTGIALKVNQFLWFIQFPYRFSLYFGISDIIVGAISLFFIIALGLLYYNNHLKGGNMTINDVIIIGFFLATGLLFMKLINLIIFISFALGFAIVIYNESINHIRAGSN